MERSEVKTQSITNSKGIKLSEFKKHLIPNYFKAWWDITIGYLFLLLSIGLLHFVELSLEGLLVGIISSIFIGFFLAYIQLFFHEASHFNLHKNKKVNDDLANFLIGFLFFDDIEDYRKIHFEHHRKLGLTSDTENSYFSCLNLKYLIESLTFIRVLKVLMNRKKSRKDKPIQKIEFKLQKLLGIFIHLIIVFSIFYYFGFESLVFWFIGFFGVFPFFVSIRQLLEHRSELASCDIDYTKINHGQKNKMFKNDIFSRFLGGAGFNRHLLHHWDPQISYTNFNELEAFYLDTLLKEEILKSKTSYVVEFIKIFKFKK
jgi:fatty acid desaturase